MIDTLLVIPLRFLPAFPLKAKPANIPPQKEWEAGSAYLSWVREELDEAGREKQILLTLADGAYGTLNFWRELPECTVLAVALPAIVACISCSRNIQVLEVLPVMVLWLPIHATGYTKECHGTKVKLLSLANLS